VKTPPLILAHKLPPQVRTTPVPFPGVQGGQRSRSLRPPTGGPACIARKASSREPSAAALSHPPTKGRRLYPA
jgi:hypothetical protein